MKKNNVVWDESKQYELEREISKMGINNANEISSPAVDASTGSSNSNNSSGSVNTNDRPVSSTRSSEFSVRNGDYSGLFEVESVDVLRECQLEAKSFDNEIIDTIMKNQFERIIRVMDISGSNSLIISSFYEIYNFIKSTYSTLTNVDNSNNNNNNNNNGEEDGVEQEVVFEPNFILTRYKPEVDAFLRFLLWNFSMRINVPSPGDAMRNLRYRNEALYEKYPHLSVGVVSIPNDQPTAYQRIGNGLFNVAVPYLWDRIREKAIDEQWMDEDLDVAPREPTSAFEKVLNQTGLTKQNAWVLMERLETAYRILVFANAIIFIRYGRYRSVVDRLLKMRVVYAKNETIRLASYDFINQQLLHEGFQIAMALMPLIDSLAIQQFLRRFYRLIAYISDKMMKALTSLKSSVMPSSSQNGNDSSTNANGNASVLSNGNIHELDSTICSKCAADPACMPYVTECNHVYCYYCLKSLINTSDAASPANCLACDQQLLHQCTRI